MGILLVIVYEAALPLILIAVLIGSFFIFLMSLSDSPNEKTKRIVILGSSMSGKTTLWKQLKDRLVGYDDHISTSGKAVIASDEYRTTGLATIDSFKVKYKENEVRILATKDIGGGDLWVKYYDELITEDGTFIYFLVDLTKLQDAKQEIRSRLQLISKHIKDKKLSNCGFKIVATHFDEYEKKMEGQDYMTVRDKAINDVLKSLADKKIKNCALNIDIKHIMVANLLDSFYISEIKREITQEG
ncbi:hypothetical protein [Prevotella pectinovora]|uniref:Rab family GTPase n=1 Tax=Prevotella pectinovora TaxID=1602169 RepID=UPI00307A32F0